MGQRAELGPVRVGENTWRNRYHSSSRNNSVVVESHSAVRQASLSESESDGWLHWEACLHWLGARTQWPELLSSLEVIIKVYVERKWSLPTKINCSYYFNILLLTEMWLMKSKAFFTHIRVFFNIVQSILYVIRCFP